MTYFYELRSFNHKGECFNVREYDCEKTATLKFRRLSTNTENAYKALKKAGGKTTIVAHQIQLVKRDYNYLGLEELANWTA